MFSIICLSFIFVYWGGGRRGFTEWRLMCHSLIEGSVAKDTNRRGKPQVRLHTLNARFNAVMAGAGTLVRAIDA